MNGIIKIIVITLLFASSNAIAQDFQGVATYKSQRQIDIKLDSTQVNSEMHQQMMAMMKKQFEKTYQLTFNKVESLYKEEEQLGAPQRGDMIVQIVDTGGSDILYKNTKEGTFTNQNEVFGKVFLIEDDIEKRDWVLTTETKFIGQYKCFKATTTRQQEVVESRISINGDNEEKEEDKKEPEMEEITITAWYTTEVPVNNGPSRYQGLPGLILEIQDGDLTLLCSKIVLNPKEKIDITKPEKGQKVTQEKFDRIMDKKMKEMEERFRSNRRDGESVEIRIGG